ASSPSSRWVPRRRMPGRCAPAPRDPKQPASSIPTSRRASSAPRPSPTRISWRARASKVPRTPARCGSKARSMSSRTAISSISGSMSNSATYLPIPFLAGCFTKSGIARSIPAHNPCVGAEPLHPPEPSRTNADDRLPCAPLGRVEGGDSFVEGRDVADVRPQSSVPHALDDLTELGTIGLDNEIDRKAVDGPRLRRPDDGHQRSSGSNQAGGPLLDVAADDIEHQIDSADVFQCVAVEVDKLLRAEVERLLTVGGASGADDMGAGLTCELRHHRPDCTGRAVRDHALPRPKAAVLEKSLPRCEARDWQARAHGEVNVAWQRREVACPDRDMLGQGVVAIPVREAEHALSYRQPFRAVAEGSDQSGQFVTGDRRCSVTVAAIGPGRGPCQLGRDGARRMNLNDDIVYRCRRLGPL